MLGVFGLRPERMGFSVVESDGPPRPARSTRRGRHARSSLPRCRARAAAGLHSIVGEEELLELGWRSRALAAESLIGGGDGALKDYMDKKAVAQVLEQIAAFLELKGENPFRIRAFRTAARGGRRASRGTCARDWKTARSPPPRASGPPHSRS